MQSALAETVLEQSVIPVCLLRRAFKQFVEICAGSGTEIQMRTLPKACVEPALWRRLLQELDRLVQLH